MSILFVVHQNFSHSINCVFFFFPASRRNLSLSQTPPVSFCSRLLFFILHRLFTSCSQQQLFHNGIMVEVYLLLCSVVEEQYFFFFSFSRDLAVWICIMSWLNWKGIDARLMCVHVLWRDEQMWCQFTRPFCWMVVKKKNVPWKIAPLRIYFADATVARVWRTVLPVSSREHRGHLTALFTCHVTSPRRWRAAASQPFDLPRLNFNPVIEKVILSSLSYLFFLASVSVLQHAVHAAGREEI